MQIFSLVKRFNRYYDVVGSKSIVYWIRFTLDALLRGVGFAFLSVMTGVWVIGLTKYVVSYVVFGFDPSRIVLAVSMVMVLAHLAYFVFGSPYHSFKHHAYRATSLFWLNQLKFCCELCVGSGLDPRKSPKVRKLAKKALFYVERTAHMDHKAGHFNDEKEGIQAGLQAIKAIERLKELSRE